MAFHEIERLRLARLRKKFFFKSSSHPPLYMHIIKSNAIYLKLQRIGGKSSFDG